jgi:hypothetical protein
MGDEDLDLNAEDAKVFAKERQGKLTTNNKATKKCLSRNGKPALSESLCLCGELPFSAAC